MKTNVLYYGDNLDILRHHIPDNSIDLIYLDPPFNSQATYNVLFREESGAVSHAQIEAFEPAGVLGPPIPFRLRSPRFRSPRVALPSEGRIEGPVSPFSSSAATSSSSVFPVPCSLRPP